MKIDFWIALMTRLDLPDSKNLNRTECVVSDSKPNWIGSNRTEWTGPIGLNRKQHEKLDWIGFLTEMSRIESDRMNRTDWIESIEWIESDRTRCTGRLNRKQNRKVGMIQIRIGLYRPCLEAIKSFVWGMLKSNTNLTTNVDQEFGDPRKVGHVSKKCFLNKFVGCLEGLRHVWKLTGIWLGRK